MEFVQHKSEDNLAEKMGLKDYSNHFVLVFACLLPFIGGFVLSFAFDSQNSVKGWYDNLVLPDFRPPNYVFGPVWTCLYLMMGYASYRVWKTGGGFSGMYYNKFYIQ